MRQAGATPHRGARASHHRGPSSCGAQAPDAQAQYLWLTGPAAPRHVGSSQARARTCAPCIGRQTLNHCATREALILFYFYFYFFLPFMLSRVDDRVLVLQLGVRAIPLRWRSQVQHIAPPETCQLHIISNGEYLPEISISTSRPSSTQ